MNNLNQQPNFRKKPDSWPFAAYIVISIIEFLFCGVIWGIAGFILTIQANNAFKADDVYAFERKKGYAEFCFVVGVALMLTFAICRVLFHGALS